MEDKIAEDKIAPEKTAEPLFWCIICHRVSARTDWPEDAPCPCCGALSHARYEWASLRRYRNWLPEIPEMDVEYNEV